MYKQFTVTNWHEVLLINNMKCLITLCDNTVWELTDYMFVEEFEQTTKDELIDEGWEEVKIG